MSEASRLFDVKVDEIQTAKMKNSFLSYYFLFRLAL